MIKYDIRAIVNRRCNITIARKLGQMYGKVGTQPRLFWFVNRRKLPVVGEKVAFVEGTEVTKWNEIIVGEIWKINYYNAKPYFFINLV